jgi:glycerophosphoryl diester phosphodiesterase
MGTVNFCSPVNSRNLPFKNFRMKLNLNSPQLFGELFAQAWHYRKVLFGTAFFHRLLGLMVLWPVLNWLINRLVQASGESALSNEAIVESLLSPVGIGSALLCIAIGIAIGAIELSSLMAQNFVHREGYRLSIPQAIRFSLRQGGTTFVVVLQVLLYGLLLAVPFLAALVGVGWMLLGDHDINFYLSERPPKFYLALLLAGLIAVCGLWFVLPYLASWSLALPLKLLFNLRPSEAIRASHRLIWPQRWQVARIWFLWLLAQFLLSWVFSGLVYGLARWLVPYTLVWIPTLLLTLGGFFLLYLAGSLILSLFQAVSFAVLCVGLFQRLTWAEERTAAMAGLSPFPDRRIVLNDVLRATLEPTPGLPDSGSAPIEAESLDHPSRRWLWIAAALALGSLATGFFLSKEMIRDESPLVIAHRGAAGLAPENTLAAFEQAIQDGADFVELDVMETADGQVVVFHDKDYMKVAGVSTRVWEQNYAELSRIDIGSRFDPAFSDQRTPLLAAALRLCKDRVQVMIELKDYGHGQRLVERVIEIVEQEQMSDQIVVMSLNLNLVKETKRNRPAWTVGFLSAVSIGQLVDVEADFLAVNSKMATRSFISQAQRRNKPVYVWTVDAPETMIQLMIAGVDGIITNRPDTARQAIQHFSETGPIERLLLEASLRLGIVPARPALPALDTDA